MLHPSVNPISDMYKSTCPKYIITVTVQSDVSLLMHDVYVQDPFSLIDLVVSSVSSPSTVRGDCAYTKSC